MLRNTNQTIGGLIPVYRSDTGVPGDQLPAVGANGPSLLFPSLRLPEDAAHEWMYWVEQSNFPAGFWPLAEDGTGSRGPYHTGAYSAMIGVYRDGVRVFGIPVYMIVGSAAATAAATSGVIWTSYSTDGQTFSQERAASAPGPGQANKRVGWRTCGQIGNWRIQNFRWLSDVNVSVLRLNVEIEPLLTRPGSR